MLVRYLVVLLTALFAVAPASARDLTVVSWGGAYQAAQRKVYFTPFTAATGIPVSDESWSGGLETLRLRGADGPPRWDVVQVESEELAQGCAEGLFEPLDIARIGGRDTYIREAITPCGVGAIVYNFVLGYDHTRLTPVPAGWADFFDTRRFPGKRALRQGPKTNLEIALIADGVPPSQVYAVLAAEAGQQRALRKLDTLRDHLVWWRDGAEPPDWLLSGKVVMSSIYNGRVDAANRQHGNRLAMVWEGSLFTLDSWVILKGSPFKETALRFLAFAGDPMNQRYLPEEIPYGVTARVATALVSPERLAVLPTNPYNMENALEIDTAFWLKHGETLGRRFRLWLDEPKEAAAE
jgi:putative spermidine/putrescine transport system substrate-binding protein